jgi:hypothetical protein
MTGKIGRYGLLSALALTVVLPQAVSAMAAAAPANDNFANATSMAFLPFEDSYVDITSATVQSDEPGCYGSPQGTVWYKLQPSQGYTLKLRAIPANGIDLVVVIFEGTSLDALNAWGCVDQNSGGTKETVIQAVSPGHTYYFQVGSNGPSDGSFTLRARKVVGPVNDTFAGALSVAMGSVNTISTVNTSLQDMEPGSTCSDGVGHTVWYRHTPTTTRTVVANTVGSDFDTVLTVWSGADINSLESVACNDDRGVDLQSRVKFTMQPGLTYYFQIGGYHGLSGNLVFTLRKA